MEITLNINEISLEHGYGGKKSQELLEKIISPILYQNNNPTFLGDSAIFNLPNKPVAFTTDSFVISPIFFPGGDIGKLSVCGTINDLCVSGAKPIYLSCGLIIEDGFSIEELKKILQSMYNTATKEGVKIVTGDTKVVEKGSADKIFINTSGIGVLYSSPILGIHYIEEGDVVLVTGTIGDHGMTIFSLRNQLNINSTLQSDCNSVKTLVETILENCNEVKVMRDPTRGGLATTLNEFVNKTNYSIELLEESIPMTSAVRGLSEMLGMDPLCLANEGKVVCILPERFANTVISELRKNNIGKDAAIIGKITKKHKGLVYLRTITGGQRIVDSLLGESLPRIC